MPASSLPPLTCWRHCNVWLMYHVNSPQVPTAPCCQNILARHAHGAKSAPPSPRPPDRNRNPQARSFPSPALSCQGPAAVRLFEPGGQFFNRSGSWPVWHYPSFHHRPSHDPSKVSPAIPRARPIRGLAQEANLRAGLPIIVEFAVVLLAVFQHIANRLSTPSAGAPCTVRFRKPAALGAFLVSHF